MNTLIKTIFTVLFLALVMRPFEARHEGHRDEFAGSCCPHMCNKRESWLEEEDDPCFCKY